MTVCTVVSRICDHCSCCFPIGAKIAADEFIQPELSMDYDGKRDRWRGYDPSEHKAIIEEYQKIEEAKRQLRADKLNSAVDGDIEVPELLFIEFLKTLSERLKIMSCGCAPCLLVSG